MLFALLLAAAPNMTVETLGETRFRVTIVLASNARPAVTALALFRLMEEAARLCRGHGRAASEGSLQIDQVAGRPDRTSLSEIYNCIAPPAR
jgi:hypothetical protein